jgi:ribosome-associated protein
MVSVVDPIQVRGKVIPADELSWRFSRSSGPGGQSVNTSDSRVELSYDVASSSALGPVLRERALTALADRLVNGVLTISASEQPAARGPQADQAHPRFTGTQACGQAAPVPDQTAPAVHG